MKLHPVRLPILAASLAMLALSALAALPAMPATAPTPEPKFHRVELKVEHLVRDLPPVYEKFFADINARTCKKCGALHPGRKPPAGWANI